MSYMYVAYLLFILNISIEQNYDTGQKMVSLHRGFADVQSGSIESSQSMSVVEIEKKLYSKTHRRMYSLRTVEENQDQSSIFDYTDDRIIMTKLLARQQRKIVGKVFLTSTSERTSRLQHRPYFKSVLIILVCNETVSSKPNEW